MPSATALPSAFVACDQWVCWRTQERDGKPTKVPINPHTTRFGSATDPDAWSDFETARETAEEGGVDGIGFVFTAEDPFVGIDLDDCRVPETSTLTDDAEAIASTLESYTEVSPSGTGVHVLVEGALPGERNRHDWVECYDDARFFTVTGDHVADTPTTIEARSAELETVYAEYVRPADRRNEGNDGTSEAEPSAPDSSSPGAPTETRASPTELDDTELIKKAQDAANGEKSARLWRGDTSGYESHTEADMALCSLLAFWTGGERARIDRLFRESGLMREKWDEEHFADGSTYGEKTIERVLASTDDVYTPAERATDSMPTGASTRHGKGTQTTASDPAAVPDLAQNDSTTDRRDLETQVQEPRAHVERLELSHPSARWERIPFRWLVRLPNKSPSSVRTSRSTEIIGTFSTIVRHSSSGIHSAAIRSIHRRPLSVPHLHPHQTQMRPLKLAPLPLALLPGGGTSDRRDAVEPMACERVHHTISHCAAAASNPF